MTYDETMNRLKEMESRYQDGFSSLDRSLLDSLYFNIFGREITNRGCSDCYRDAYMEILIHLKRTKAMPKKSDFVLKAGAIITFFGEPLCYSNANITDEAALRFLSLNPSNEKLFESLPADWKSRFTKSDAPEAEDKDAVIARLTKENEQLRMENEALKASASRKKAKKKSEPEPNPVPEVSHDELTVETATKDEAPGNIPPADADEVSIEEPEDTPDKE